VNTTVRYVFAHHEETSDPALYDRLILHGVTPKMTRDLIKNFGNETVRNRLEEVEAITQGRGKTGPGFLVAFIREPEGYRGRFAQTTTQAIGTTQNAQQAKVSVVSAAGSVPFQPALLSLPSGAARGDLTVAEDWETISQDVRVKRTVLLLKGAFGKRFTGGQYEAMREAMEVGAMSTEMMRTTALRAMADATQDDCAAGIRQQLYQISSLGTP